MTAHATATRIAWTTVMRAVASALVGAVVVAACSSDIGSAPDRASSVSIITTTTAPATTTTTITTTATTTTTAAGGDPDTTGSASTEPAAPTTTSVATTSTTTTIPPVVGEPVVAAEPVGEFDSPVDLAVRPGDDRLYVVEQGGRVVRHDGSESVRVFDISGRVSTGGEQGLLGLVFSPGGQRGYVNFTNRSGDTVIAEYQLDADGAFDMATERVLLRVDQPFANHNAGDLEFGPDGMLFIPLGDGGSGGDPQRHGSNPSTLLGSLLRIDPTPDGDSPYSIPADNPFADGTGGAPEIWSTGLRNPWKIAFDPVTGELWIPDVGQNLFEEINVVAPVDGAVAGRGADFGWSAYEGTERFDAEVADPGGLTFPVLTYGRADGCSISGGVPYRGSAIPQLAPAFVYSDFCTGAIWAFDLAGSRNLTLATGFDSVAAIRTGPDGELYVIERSGTLHRLVAG